MAMEISVTEFKAKCLALIEQVHRTREPLVITKRGKAVAELRAARSDEEEAPWAVLEDSVSYYGDPFEPSVSDDEIESAG